ncbi:MAG: GNAT family N-acetyltransferase [Bacteroides sp.]|nr:GNAT family N-acetyltransferase [Bacteroides sp.]
MAGVWDGFVDASRNGTFILRRGFMDYHADRFADRSLLAMKGGAVMALLPANLVREADGRLRLCSHGGLTYGGLVLPPRHVDATDVLDIFRLITGYCREEGISVLDYKPIPDIYAAMPSEEDRYALFRLGARMEVCNLSCAIDLRHNPGFNTRQRRNLRRALGYGPVYGEVRGGEVRGGGVNDEMSGGRQDSTLNEFYGMLCACLAERHDARPVHALEELELLKRRFPQHIRIHTCADSDGIQAGICVFDTGRVAHCQYIASTAQGRDRGLLTALFHHLITEVYASRVYFDFGTSNEDSGRILNPGLYAQKSALGGSGVLYPRFILDIK